MYTIFIDTHSDKIIIVLYKNNEVVVKEEVATHQDHSVTTMPVLIESLEKAKIDIKEVKEILVVNGPGSFTGVRIGVTIAKTLAFTLQIPIKTMSSLLIKAVSFLHDEIRIVEREKNGVFLGKFSKNNQLIDDYIYIPNRDYKKLVSDIEEVKIDYKKIIDFSKALESKKAHSVNPLYVKKIEVQK